MSEHADESWIQYHDEETNASFWHNSETGESRWAEEAAGCNTFKAQRAPSGRKTKEKKKKNKRKGSGEKSTGTTDSAAAKKSQRSGNQEYDDEFVDLLREQELYDRTGGDISHHRKCFYLNMILLEYPLVVLEGCIRTCFLCLLGMALVLISILLCTFCSRHAAKNITSYLLMCGREVILTAAATLSLSVPFVILFVYRNYDSEHAWDLSPLPTLVGRVDARRFAIVTMGQGSGADNVDILLEETNGVSSQTQDTWGGGNTDYMILFPRVFIKHLLD